MGGKPTDPNYWRRYRATHPKYVQQERERKRRARAEGHRENRSREYARRQSRAAPPLPLLYPALQRGARISFWSDELRIDLEQERALAALEGRDPEEAVKRYKNKELEWYSQILTLGSWK